MKDLLNSSEVVVTEQKHNTFDDDGNIINTRVITHVVKKEATDDCNSDNGVSVSLKIFCFILLVILIILILKLGGAL